MIQTEESHGWAQGSSKVWSVLPAAGCTEMVGGKGLWEGLCLQGVPVAPKEGPTCQSILPHCHSIRGDVSRALNYFQQGVRAV